MFVDAVLHDMRLTHTDLKPENILFVNSDYDIEYSSSSKKVVAFDLCDDVVQKVKPSKMLSFKQ